MTCLVVVLPFVAVFSLILLDAAVTHQLFCGIVFSLCCCSFTRRLGFMFACSRSNRTFEFTMHEMRRLTREHKLLQNSLFIMKNISNSRLKKKKQKQKMKTGKRNHRTKWNIAASHTNHFPSTRPPPKSVHVHNNDVRY